MFAALRGRYLQFVIFMGVAEHYPDWFIEEVSERIFVNESRYTFWTPPYERLGDYYEKELIEDFSIVLRKPDGLTHVAEVETFDDLYQIFRYDKTTNSGVAAFREDIIEYVECIGGGHIETYPKWFYEYFTELVNNPKDEESYLFTIDGCGHITVKERCMILRNRFGEIRQMSYGSFLQYYDPRIENVRCGDPSNDHDYWWEGCPF